VTLLWGLEVNHGVHLDVENWVLEMSGAPPSRKTTSPRLNVPFEPLRKHFDH